MKSIKLGLDIGASRLKASFFKGNMVMDICFPNTIDYNTATSTGIKVNFNDEYLTVGSVSGYNNSTTKKINYTNLEQLVFAAAYKVRESLNLDDTTLNLDINTVLPPAEFIESREQYKERFKSINGKTAIVNGVPITLNITDVKVGAEGVALLNACNLDNLTSNLSQVLILDVGSSTTDIIILSKTDDVWSIKDAITSRIAGREMCRAIETSLNSGGTGLTFEWSELERNQYYELDGEQHELSKEIDACDHVVKALIAELRKIGNIRQYKVILTGAGSRLLKESNEFKAYTKFSCIENNLLDFGNSRGALKS